MTKFHSRWISGFWLIFIDFNVGIDIFPDFIGWFLIATAFSNVKVTGAKWGMIASIVAGISAIPLVVPLQFGDLPTWLIVMQTVRSAGEFLAFAAFFVVSDYLLRREKKSIFEKVLLIFLLFNFTWGHVFMHFNRNSAETLAVFLGVLGFVLTIIFFVKLYSRRKEFDSQKFDVQV